MNRQGPGAVKPDLLWAGEAIIVAACNGVPVAEGQPSTRVAAMLAEANRLVERHIALPYVALRGMASRGNDVVTRDDLLQAGMMGLVEAARRYDPAQEAAFSTFAMLRIRGAMLDAIRQSDRTRVRWMGRWRWYVAGARRRAYRWGCAEDPVTGRLEEQAARGRWWRGPGAAASTVAGGAGPVHRQMDVSGDLEELGGECGFQFIERRSRRQEGDGGGGTDGRRRRGE